MITKLVGEYETVYLEGDVTVFEIRAKTMQDISNVTYPIRYLFDPNLPVRCLVVRKVLPHDVAGEAYLVEGGSVFLLNDGGETIDRP